MPDAATAARAADHAPAPVIVVLLVAPALGGAAVILAAATVNQTQPFIM